MVHFVLSMNHPIILVVARSYALSQSSDNTLIPLSLADYFYALPWSQEAYNAFTNQGRCWSCVWLPLESEHLQLLGEFALLRIPLTLIIEEKTIEGKPEQMRSAANLMARYPNICGIAFEPFDNAQCEYLMAKMRNFATVRRFWNALELTLFPSKAPSILDSIGLENDHVVYAEAQNQYTDIYNSHTEKYLLTQTLGSLVQQLEAETPFGKPVPLLRVHDKYAVNPAHVSAVRPSESKRDYVLTLSSGKELPLSRTYKHNLAKLPVKVKRSRAGGRTSGGKNK